MELTGLHHDMEKFMSQNKKSIFLNEKGMTLIEMMVTVAITGIVTMLAATVISYSSTEAHSVDMASSALADSTLFRVELERAVDLNAISGKVWLNQQIVNALQIPWMNFAGAVTDSVGSIGVLQNSTLDDNGAIVPDTTGKFDLFVFVQKSTQLSPVTIGTNTFAGTEPGYIISSNQTSQTFNISLANSADAYPIGSTVAVSSLSGTQFAQVQSHSATTITLDWSNFGSFQFNNVAQNWPNLYLTSGISIFPLRVQILGANPAETSLSLWEVDLTGGKYNKLDTLPYTPISMKATDLTAQGVLTNFMELHQTPFEILIVTKLEKSLVLQIFKIEQPL